jgi:alkaline phosphatase
MRILLAILLLVQFAQAQNNAVPAKPKNVILMIGDGMGLTQISYAMMEATQRLNFQRFQEIGLMNTTSSDSKVTDSAAGATAFACGVKSYSGAIGVDSTQKPVTNLVEIFHKNGLSCGLIATSTITHATPASFASHQPKRDMYQEIAKDLLHSDVEFLAGGGIRHFTKRDDEKNLLDSFKNKGYVVDTNFNSFLFKDGKKMIGLFAPMHMPKVTDREEILEPLSVKGIEQLNQNKKGFFLMIEGSQIDFGGHDNDINYVVTELYEFDKAIGTVLDFAEKDGNTLVIVTADHETGGLSLPGENDSYHTKKLDPKFSNTAHTGCMVPVFAYGPGSQLFKGIYDNTDIFKKIVLLKEY